IEVLAPRDTLFSTASISPCDQPVIDRVILLGWCQHELQTLHLTGPDSDNFWVFRRAHDSLLFTDTVILGFTVKKPGTFVAELLLGYGDTTITIPLYGRGIPGPSPSTPSSTP